MPRYYAVYEIEGSGLAPEDSSAVVVFTARSRRDAWVAYDLDGDDEPILTRGGTRSACSRQYAAAALRRIMQSAHGGRQSGYEALRELREEWHPETPTAEQMESAAAMLGRRGGQSRSAAKIAAVRANGAKGGRPKSRLVD